MRLSNKEVVLGITGSIAAYKACEIASLLTKRGVAVTPVLTRSAQELIGAASLEAVTGRRAILEMFGAHQNPEVSHIAVATRASLFLIAPATANILAKAAHGIADDWLSTALLATRAPVLFAPAMNTNMYAHPATQANIETLRGRGCRFVGPDSGTLACKTVGLGRMSEPQTVVEAALPLIDGRTDLAGRHVVITSGSTQEPIDPVRFIGNRSSGKMGRALALEALCRGARVSVISGPAETPLPHGVETTPVQTAGEMGAALDRLVPDADVIIGAAAVADYRLSDPAPTKRKRTGAALTLTLTENPDLIARAGAARRPGQVVVGFAAETSDLIENGRAKIAAKSLDLILVNEVGAPDSGFGVDTLRAYVLDAHGGVEDLGVAAKADVAAALFDRVCALLA